MLDFLPNQKVDVDFREAVLSSGTSVLVATPEEETENGLVLIPDVFGLRPLIKETIIQIASNSISVIAIEPFSYMAENPSLISREEKLSRVKDLDDQLQCSDILAAGKILRNTHGCNNVCLIGFCIGGMYAFKSSGAGEFDSVVSCYGMITMPVSWQGPGQKDALDYLTLDTCSRVLAIIGEDDHGFAKEEDVQSLQETLGNAHHKKVGSRVEIFKSCGHAFMHDPDREEYRSEDAKLAWEMAFDFFGFKYQ